MRRLELLLACVFLCAACGEAHKDDAVGGSQPADPGEVSINSLVSKDGLTFAPGIAEPFSGTAVERFKDGALAVSSEYVAGKLHGKRQEWLKSGTKKRETLYRDGEAYFQTVWRSDGTKKIESGMKGDIPHGAHKRWHPNGKLGFDGGFYEGKFHGVVVDRDENGELLVHARFEKGERVEDLMPKPPVGHREEPCGP